MIPKHHISFSEDELNSFLKISIIICASVLALFLVAKTINEVRTYSTIGDDASGPNAVQNTITVTGKSDMDVKPDITTFSWTVDATGKTVEETQAKVATVANKALAYLRSNGIADADLKTSGFYTNTHYDTKVQPCVLQVRSTSASASKRGSSAPASTASAEAVAVSAPEIAPVIVSPCGSSQSVPTGYDVSETVNVIVRNINTQPEKTGQLIAGLGSLGVKASNPESTIENPDIYKEEVRGEAIAKAREQAQILASQLGVKLGKVSSFNESTYPYPMAYGVMSASAMDKSAVAPELPVGTNKITSEVTIVYQIK